MGLNDPFKRRSGSKGCAAKAPTLSFVLVISTSQSFPLVPFGTGTTNDTSARVYVQLYESKSAPFPELGSVVSSDACFGEGTLCACRLHASGGDS